jgi:Zn-dependent protease
MNNFFSGIMQELLNLLPAVPAILWAISFHEFCHAWAACRLGDTTARDYGRLTLNPLAHFDVWGLVCMLLFKFGWAKPVPIDTRNFRKPRRDIVIVSLAGVTGNIITAVAAGLLIRALARFAPAMFYTNYGLQLVLLSFVAINLNFALFNLLPVPPLDGSRLILMLLPPSALRAAYNMERYGFIILLALIYLGVADRVLLPISRWAMRLIIG